VLRAGIVFGGVCGLCVCLCVYVSVRTNLENCWSEIVAICLMVNARSAWKLVTFDLESYFRSLSIQAVYCEWLDLAAPFLVWRYIFRISKSHESTRVKSQRHGSEKTIACNSKTTGRKLLGLDRNMCYGNAKSDSKLLTFDLDLWPWDIHSYFSS